MRSLTFILLTYKNSVAVNYPLFYKYIYKDSKNTLQGKNMTVPDLAKGSPPGNSGAASLAQGLRELLALQGMEASEAQARGVAKTLMRLAPPARPQEPLR
ncbi:hypothetical protein FOC84_06120 [Achromobacter pestifer]|uniref:Uncharacterized protein n=1 Tax=Achromobacter pestifer TaxID=1353889 RepID=A0A7D4E2I0_9BURK|nr:hypothetical protein [Achromobacter pestifer]QKH34551.1 hypothetical protein FOC84_06120 [Achromobacter pestifer]